jgi:hypothetical protein
MDFLKKYKEDKKIQSKRNITIIMSDYEKADDLLSKFGIEQDELEDIFDLIAKEHPDL